jgi:cytidylate kinase
MARAILAIGAKGKAVIVGRGAGAILPAAGVLHVRIVAPLGDRIAWISQIHRFTKEQAREHIQNQDKQRTNVLDIHFKRPSRDASLYDLVLNSSRLGEQGCAHLIADAALHKQEMIDAAGGPSSGSPVETLG